MHGEGFMTVQQWLAGVNLGGIAIGLALHTVANRLPGRYQVAVEAAGAWRLDTLTGNLSYCVNTGIETAPMCGPWGAQSLEQFRASKATR